jgi:alpha-amylase/alpha-mannosidase (GH57 family)
VDLLLTPSGDLSPEQRVQVKGNGWSCFSIAQTALNRFPDLRALREKRIDDFSAGDILHAKLLFALANFDPAFLRGPVRLVTKEVVDCSDLVREEPPGTFRLRRTLTEDDANRVLAESVKILEAILPAHRALRYDPDSGRGQIEVATTPFYHPILPLLVDTELARFGQPEDPRPPRFRHPEDARAHVLKSVRLFEEIFGARPTGMWPAEGSVAQEVVPIFADAGIRWIATTSASHGFRGFPRRASGPHPWFRRRVTR